MKLSNFIKKENCVLILAALTDFMNAKLLSVRCNANDILVKEFCSQISLPYNTPVIEHAEISVTFPDIQAVQKIRADLKIETNEAFTPVLLNKYPHLVEIGLMFL